MTDPQRVAAGRGFLDYDSQARAEVLLDAGSMRVVCGPEDRITSPWLAPQGIVPRADDGVVIARGTVDGRPVVVASIEQRFLGGALGEVSGAKITEAVRSAARDSRAGVPTAAILLLETGGVRLQEAHLGLNAVAELCSAVLDLRPLAPVIGVAAGDLGCFGGVALAAGLCTRFIVTPRGRLGLNGPAVIEHEAGVAEFDSSDRALIWAIDGGEQRQATGLADFLVAEDPDDIREAVRAALAAGVSPAGTHRSERLDVLASRVATVDPANPPQPRELRARWGASYEPVDAPRPRSRGGIPVPGRGRTWLTALGGEPTAVIPSVLRADADDAVYLAVVSDPDNPFHRARHGEVGLTESLTLARTIRSVIAEDQTRERDRHRAIVAIVDVPSQAYGRVEEMVGLHQAIATTIDAYHAARVAGHPVIALVVGQAYSGGFLAHGLQAHKILALDDPGVEIHAMHRDTAARISMGSVERLDELAEIVPPLSYDVRVWADLGFCAGLDGVGDADTPTPTDVDSARRAIRDAIAAARRGPDDLSNRMDSPAAVRNRAASRAVRDVFAREWPAR